MAVALYIYIISPNPVACKCPLVPWQVVPWHLHHIVTFTSYRDIYIISWHLHHIVTFTSYRDIYIISWHLHHIVTFTSYCDIYNISWHLHHIVIFTSYRGIYIISWHLHHIVTFTSYRDVTFTSYRDIYIISWHLHHIVTFTSYCDIYIIIIIYILLCRGRLSECQKECRASGLHCARLSQELGQQEQKHVREKEALLSAIAKLGGANRLKRELEVRGPCAVQGVVILIL